MNTYADTSVLFSLYVPDANSPAVDAWRRNHGLPLPFTRFHRVELRNALCLAVFRRQLTATEATDAWKDIETDIATGLLAIRRGPWHRVLVEAEKIASAQTSSVGTRTLDLIHVAAAKVLGFEFCSCDKRQCDLATKVGLVTITP